MASAPSTEADSADLTRRCKWLLGLLVFGVLAQPVVADLGVGGRVVLSLAFLGAFATGVLALAEVPRHRAVATVLAVLSALGAVAALVVPFDDLWPHAVIDGLHALFFGHVAWVLFRFVWRGGSAAAGTRLIAALCVYLLIGVFWSQLYLVLQIFAAAGGESAFHGVAVSELESVGEAARLLTYFSFVTLTTLGYGDVAPATAIARTLCLAEAVIGVLYLATMVASLVGRQQQESRG